MSAAASAPPAANNKVADSDQVVILQPAAAASGWDGRALRSRCECHNCLAGLTTALHADDSHDQSLTQHFTLATTPPAGTTPAFVTTGVAAAFESSADVTIRGGTTKCARVAVQHFASAAFQSQFGEWKNARVIEVGAGTGLVSICVALLGARVIATDQEPVLDTLRSNIRTNTEFGKHAITTAALQWGDAESHTALVDIITRNFAAPTAAAATDNKSTANITTAASATPQTAAGGSTDSKASDAKSKGESAAAASLDSVIDVVVGSDLIYAKEGIPPLVSTFERLLYPPSRAGTCVYLVSIFRFEWEKEFFVQMSKHFTQSTVLTSGDIRIDRFVPKPADKPAAVASAAAATAATAASK